MTQEKIRLAHGSGGSLMRELITSTFQELLSNDMLDPLDDSAIISNFGPGRIAFTTDSMVVSPIFFPGGDIGKLAVVGTVNDLAVVGAKPLYLSLACILEEGFEIDSLRKIVQSIAETARGCGVQVVTGDTKVVERGKGDKIFINTAGIGRIPEGCPYRSGGFAVGDHILVNGPVGDHGAVIMSAQAGISLESDLVSDCAPLHGLIDAIMDWGAHIRFMRDATRGGIVSILNEIASRANMTIALREEDVPVRPEVSAICEILGLEPYYLANEGKVVVVVDPAYSKAVLESMRAHPLGVDSRCIGEITASDVPIVVMKTAFGGSRILDVPVGEALPRIC